MTSLPIQSAASHDVRFSPILSKSQGFASHCKKLCTPGNNGGIVASYFSRPKGGNDHGSACICGRERARGGPRSEPSRPGSTTARRRDLQMFVLVLAKAAVVWPRNLPASANTSTPVAPLSTRSCHHCWQSSLRLASPSHDLRHWLTSPPSGADTGLCQHLKTLSDSTRRSCRRFCVRTIHI